MDQRPKAAVSGTHRLGNTAFHLVPLLVICALWLPYFLAYRVPGITVTDAMMQQARQSPPDEVLDELQSFHFGPVWKNKDELIAAASDLLKGNMRTEGCSTRINLPFSANDFDNVAPGCDLLFAAFVAPDVWLQAYDATGRTEFFNAAEAFITHAQAYEQSAVLPRGLLWNDHAVAARISVLGNFWRLYRHSPGFRPEVARQVLQMVARSEQLLAKPGQFTVATNHGIMQNLALWHGSLAFPSLPQTEAYQRLARERLTDQMKFYVSDEGVVLEHSAGYHSFGIELFGMAIRYLDLMHEPVPPDWTEKYQRGEKFYAALRRPNGSLPMFGDTDNDADPLGPLVTMFDRERHSMRLAYQSDWKPAEAVSLYPVSGYAIWWDGLEHWPNPRDLSQTVVEWSNFPSQSHKHADEMSVLFWAGGQTWLNNVGYWPYENRLRNASESWAGSDAPHLVGENPAALRTTKLLASGSSEHLTAIDLERTGVENYVARRQVIHCQPNLWLVLDNTSGPETSRTTTTWTSGPEVSWQQGQNHGSFRLESSNISDRMDMFFLGSQDTEQRLFRGSSTPFAGWQLDRHVPVPASALVVEQPARNSWAATIWTWEKEGSAGRLEGSPRMAHWTDATHWEVLVPREGGLIELRREGDTLRLHTDRDNAELALVAPLDVTPAYAEVSHQFTAASARYPMFSANLARRKKVTYLLLAIFLLQQIFFALYKRFHGPRVYALKCLNMLVWIAGGIWLVVFFL